MKIFRILNRRILFTIFLVAFLLVSVIPLLIFSYNSIIRTQDELKSSMNENNYLITRHILNKIEESQIQKWISNLHGLSSSLTYNKVPDQNYRDAIINSYFDNVSELVVLSVKKSYYSEPKHYINEKYLGEFTDQDSEILSKLFYFNQDSTAIDEPVIIDDPIFLQGKNVILLPIEIKQENSGTPYRNCRGVFILTSMFEFINSEMSMVQREIYIVSNKGKILFQNIHGQFTSGELLPYPIEFPDYDQHHVFQTVHFSYLNKSYLSYFSQTSLTEWYVIVVYAGEKAYSMVSQARQYLVINILIALILSVVMSLLFAWFHANIIIRDKRALQNYAEKLEQSNKEQEAFANSVSHDLKAPLTRIKGYADILEMRLSSTLDKKSLNQLKNISKASIQLHNLVHNILIFSRMSRAEINKTRIQLKKVINWVKTELESETKSRQIEWKILPLRTVWGDFTMIRQVMFNLVCNSVKFTSNEKKAVIEIGTQSTDSEVIVFVKDNGVGFDMKNSQQLFELFQRLHTEEHFKGSGVGLAHVRRIIAKHGGKTWAEGETSKGATFYFSLPLKTS